MENTPGSRQKSWSLNQWVQTYVIKRLLKQKEYKSALYFSDRVAICVEKFQRDECLYKKTFYGHLEMSVQAYVSFNAFYIQPACKVKGHPADPRELLGRLTAQLQQKKVHGNI